MFQKGQLSLAEDGAFVTESLKSQSYVTTPWGTFMYSKMPFGLMNVGATF